MALRLSNGLVTKLLGTGSLATIMNGGFIRVFSGAQPLTPEGVETGALLAQISSTSGTVGLQFGTAGSGILPKAATVWSGTCGTSGIAGYFRFYDANVFTGVDNAGTSCRFDGDIGTITGTLLLSNTNLVVGAPIIIDVAQFTIPENQS